MNLHTITQILWKKSTYPRSFRVMRFYHSRSTFHFLFKPIFGQSIVVRYWPYLLEN